MEFFSDAEMVKLITLSGAFVVGVIVCIYVAIKETMELKRRRREKQMMYKQTINNGGMRKSRRNGSSDDGIYA